MVCFCYQFLKNKTKGWSAASILPLRLFEHLKFADAMAPLGAALRAEDP
jgi:hypothetical protein